MINDPQTLNERKMYVLVDSSLSPGLQAAQACHAVAEMCLREPSASKVWNRQGNYMIVLAVSQHEATKAWFDAHGKEIPCAQWREPDLGNVVTATAYLPEPKDNEMFAHLPLALSKRPWFRRLLGA